MSQAGTSLGFNQSIVPGSTYIIHPSIMNPYPPPMFSHSFVIGIFIDTSQLLMGSIDQCVIHAYIVWINVTCINLLHDY